MWQLKRKSRQEEQESQSSKRLQDQAIRDREAWIARFDGYLNEMLYMLEDVTPCDIVRKAEEVCDLRESLISRRFPER